MLSFTCFAQVNAQSNGNGSLALTPIVDAYVKGADADVNTNYGSAPELQVKRTLNEGSGNGRQSYLRFDTSNLPGTLAAATLRVYGRQNVVIGANQNIPCAVFPVSTVWDETTLTWNNRPAPNAPGELARVVVTDDAPRWYEFDITDFVNAERAAGRTVTGVLLRNMIAGEPGDYYTVFNSKEAATNRPELLLTPAPPPPPASLLLNGNSYVNVPHSNSLNITGAVTVEAWIKRAAAGDTAIIEKFGTSGGGYALRIQGEKLHFLTLQNSATYDAVTGNSTVTIGAWHHVAGIFDGTQMRVYLNGVVDGSKASNFAPATGTTNLRIGVAGDADARFFNGLIDEARLTPEALYRAEAFTPEMRLTAGGIRESETGRTVGMWNFDGQPTLDLSGFSNHGYLAGGAGFSSDVHTETDVKDNSGYGKLAEPSPSPVVINFDNVPTGTFISNQYPIAKFSSVNRSVRTGADSFTQNGVSPPNWIAPYFVGNFNSYFDLFGQLIVNFTQPVNNLVFWSIANNTSTLIYKVDVYQNGVLTTTQNIYGCGWGCANRIDFGARNLPNVTKIHIHSVIDPAGLLYDNFSFTPVFLQNVDITNPRVTTPITGTTQNALLGADITLQANPTPSNATGGTYTWTFTGPYAISSGTINSSSLKIRATDLSAISGAITARVTYTHNGTQKSGQVTINSVLPKLSSFTAVQEREFWDAKPVPGVATGTVTYRLGWSPFAPGIKWTANVTAVPGASSPYPGGPTYISDPAQSGVDMNPARATTS